jgi:hypothetical protein
VAVVQKKGPQLPGRFLDILFVNFISRSFEAAPPTPVIYLNGRAQVQVENNQKPFATL